MLAHDRHSAATVLLVLLCLGAVAFLWTGEPGDWAGLEWIREHPVLGQGFDDQGNLRSDAAILGQAVPQHQQIRLLLGLSAVGFLAVYFLPRAWKKQPLVVLALAGLGLVGGPSLAAALLLFHLACYTTFHAPDPDAPLTRWLAATACLCSAAIFPSAWLVVLWCVAWAAYRFAYYPLLKSRLGEWAERFAAHSPLVALALALIHNTRSEAVFQFPVTVLIFFWMWERLLMYHADLRDGKVPRELGPWQYLVTFLTPAYLAQVDILDLIGKGYACLDRSWLARDKNRIALGGLGLIGWSVVLAWLGPIVVEVVPRLVREAGVPAYTSYEEALHRLRLLGSIHPLSAWCCMLVAFLELYFFWASIAHLKVGLWRLFGYDLEPNFQWPFLARNLVEWWRRYMFYYREFYLQIFFYPVFFRVFPRRRLARAFAATFAAAGFGMWLLHLVESGLYRGATWEVVAAELRTIPFALLFGLSIALTHLYLLVRGRQSRPAWSGGMGAMLGDALAAAFTVGCYLLLRTLHLPTRDYSLWDLARLALSGLGIHL
ncbi:MAG: hypothetical protein HY319_16630 [Armatimonadetes bacterium]|nr:hypothetical protein [Armatimonadota bacterium]